MNQRELFAVLRECRIMFPREYERWSAVYPQRLVMLKMISKYPIQLSPVLNRVFLESVEYEEAIESVLQMMESVDR